MGIVLTDNNKVREMIVPQCVPCPLNTYQEHVGGAQCMPCPPDHDTLGMGSTSRDDCIGMLIHFASIYFHMQLVKIRTFKVSIYVLAMYHIRKKFHCLKILASIGKN